tara:strand:+ start:14020 stop:15432 length:1413 start_codon:yes stop_codon:yes gene_type:complete
MSKISDLPAGAHIHLMGICGVAMASLAGLLKNMGYKITGSDQNVYPPMSTLLEDLEIPIMEGYKKENLVPAPDFVIVGNVITKNHEEAIALLESPIPYTSLPKAMGEVLIADRRSIVVSGTHGKTTTTSMMAWILEDLGKRPGFLVGGIAKNFAKSFQLPKSDLFVIEGDEYDTAFFDKVPKFNHYRPYYVLLGKIEFDHADIYNSLEDIMQAFYGLAERANPDGIWIYNAHCENATKVSAKAKSRLVLSYGIEKGDYQARNIVYQPEAMQFDMYYQNQKIITIQTKVFGEYNVLNLMNALALCHQLELDMNQVAQAVWKFAGVKRRQEILSEQNGKVLIEDFAHHPTAVRMTIDAVKKRFQKGRVLAVFEPRSATSRRKVFQQDYIAAFQNADEIWIKKAGMQEKIQDQDRFSSEELVDHLKASGKIAHCFDHVDEGARQISESAKKGDAIVVMSNGSFDGIYQKIQLT